MKGRLLFKEEQSFMYTWSWWMIMVLTLPVLIAVIWNAFHETNSDKQLSLIIVSVISFLSLGAVIWLFTVMKLVIQVDEGILSYSFYPFASRKNIRKEDLKEIYVRKYSPIWEYGGWGYRVRLGKGKAFNVRGNWGLQLEFSNGKKLLLGTQKPKELEKAIKELKENWGMIESYG